MAEVIYSDIDSTFFAHPVKQDIVTRKNRDAVKASVKNLILTDFYERPFKPTIGCGIRNFLFELMTPSTRQQIKNAAKQVIENYEPRAEVIDVLVEDYPDKNAITISIAFFIINDPEPVVVDILLERVR